MTELPLDRCPPGHGGKILRVGGSPDLAQRLLELGFVPGTSVSVVRYAPLGDPLEVTVRGYHLSLRKREAHNIILSA